MPTERGRISTDPFLGVAETAKRLGVSVVTVRRTISRGELPAERVNGTWRISRDEVERWVAAAEAAAAARARDGVP